MAQMTYHGGIHVPQPYTQDFHKALVRGYEEPLRSRRESRHNAISLPLFVLEADGEAPQHEGAFFGQSFPDSTHLHLAFDPTSEGSWHGCIRPMCTFAGVRHPSHLIPPRRLDQQPEGFCATTIFDLGRVFW
jgi:hypothetical protein